MSRTLAMANTRMKLLAGAVVLGMAVVASAASAQTQIGGGATLPAIGYAGLNATSVRRVDPSADSMLGVVAALPRVGVASSYCQTGSGNGKNILANLTGFGVQNSCTAGVNDPNPTGFGANDPGVGRSTLTQPNFAASDSPLSQGDFSNYTTGHSGNFPVQFPAVSGSIAIAFHKAGVTSLDLSSQQICQIFSHQITDWSDTRLATVGGVPAGVSGPITVVYRSDGSGTSFNFSNYLTSVCAAADIGGGHFDTNQQFAATSGSTSTTGTALAHLTAVGATQPASYVGGNGNVNVINLVNGTDGAIGYAETANAKAQGATFATVGGLHADSDFHAVSVTPSFNAVIGPVDATTGKVSLQAIAGAPSTQCIAVVDPNTYAVQTDNYPIVAVSYLLGNVHGNGADLAHSRTLLGAPYNTAVTGSASLTQIGHGNGLAFLSGTGITTAAVNACLVD